jgi:uncharacterized protein YbcI
VRAAKQNGDFSLTTRISNEMVQAQKKYFGRGPTHAKSYILDDFLLVVMRGGLTTAESTLLESGRPDLVRGFRQELEHELGERLVASMQELTGRTIVNHRAQIVFDPHTVVEMFFFEPNGAGVATADGNDGPER